MTCTCSFKLEKFVGSNRDKYGVERKTGIIPSSIIFIKLWQGNKWSSFCGKCNHDFHNVFFLKQPPAKASGILLSGVMFTLGGCLVGARISTICPQIRSDVEIVDATCTIKWVRGQLLHLGISREIRIVTEAGVKKVGETGEMRGAQGVLRRRGTR